MKFLHTAAAVAMACALTAGCDLLSNNKKDASTTPTSPTSPGVTMDSFAGTWQSVNSTLPATGCGNLKYTVTPTGTSSANVTFTATCASNITVTGAGSGTLSGSIINWSASGLVGQGGVNCPFTFTNNKATIDSTTNQLTVNYSGTVCGIPVSGSETVKK
jgi:hypothetical protein